MQDTTVAHRELRSGAAEALRGLVEKQRARLGAGGTKRDAAGLHRLTAGGIAFVRRAVGVAPADCYALKRNIEFFGGDLRHCSEHALTELDPPGRKLDLARYGEIHPSIEAGIVGEHARQRRGCGHGRALSRRRAAAFSMARKMRLCAPQRQILSSSAWAMSARDGDGLRSSSALAEMRMPLRQYPHWPACSSRKACCSGCGLSGVPRPSIVVTLQPATLAAGRPQDFTGLPSINTMQQPHCSRPQPNRVPTSRNLLRSTSSKGVSSCGRTTSAARPLTVKAMVLSIGLCVRRQSGPIRRM